jgi:hypothetical protein
MALLGIVALLPPAAEAQSCTPYREWRTVWWTWHECCIYLNGSLPVNGQVRYYVREYRDRDPYCNWSAWKEYGDRWDTCHSGSCWVAASLDIGSELPDREPEAHVVPGLLTPEEEASSVPPGPSCRPAVLEGESVVLPPVPVTG